MKELTLDGIKGWAKTMRLSELFSKTVNRKTILLSESELAVLVMAGQELGFGPVGSVKGIHIMYGTMTYSAHIQAAVMQRGGFRWEILEHDAKICRLKVWDPKGNVMGEPSFSMDDARTAKLLSNDMWKTYPKPMLFARAISRAQTECAPGTSGGATMLLPEELGATVDAAGNVLDTNEEAPEEQPREESSAPPPEPPAAEEAPEPPAEETPPSRPPPQSAADAKKDINDAHAREVRKYLADMVLPAEAVTEAIKESYGKDKFSELTPSQAKIFSECVKAASAIHALMRTVETDIEKLHTWILGETQVPLLALSAQEWKALNVKLQATKEDKT